MNLKTVELQTTAIAIQLQLAQISWIGIKGLCLYHEKHPQTINTTSAKLYWSHNAFWQKAFSRHTPNPDSAIWLVETEPWFITPENLFPLFYCPISMGFTSHKHSTVRFCKQRLMSSSTTMEAKQMCFLAVGIYQNKCPASLLEWWSTLTHVDYRFGVVFRISLDSTHQFSLLVWWVYQVDAHSDNPFSLSTS